MKLEKFIWYSDKGKHEEWWFPNGVLHREEGPAVIWYGSSGNKLYEEWRNGGCLHREDGPAIIHYNEDGNIYAKQYWIMGQEIAEDKWKISKLPDTKIKKALYG